MGRRSLLFVVSVFFVFNLSAQTKAVSGVIKDDKGEVVPYAVVQIKGTNKGINADSLGVFTLNVKPNVVLLVNAMGYETASVNVGQQNNLSVVLKTASDKLGGENQQQQSSDDDSSRKMATNMIQDFVATLGSSSLPSFSGVALNIPSNPVSGSGMGNLYTGASLPVFTHKDDTKGSKYFFDQWVKGSAVNSSNHVVSNDTYWFNYDKIGKNLLVTTDKKTVIEINRNELNSFTCINKDKIEIVFDKVPLIDANTFMIQLLKDSTGYSLYKSLHTKFIRANYRSDGLTETGNNYDEYADEYTYYIIFPGGKQFSKVELKKKSIKAVLSKEENKVDVFFSKHSDEKLNEQFLVALLASLH